MLVKIKNDVSYSNLWEFARSIGMPVLKEWAIPKYNLTETEWEIFETGEDIIGCSDVETIEDWYSDQTGNFFVEYIDDHNCGLIRVREL